MFIERRRRNITLWEEITLKNYHSKYRGQYREMADQIDKIKIPDLTQIQKQQIINLKRGHIAKEQVNDFFSKINKKQSQYKNELPKTLNKMSARLVQIINYGIDKDFGKKYQDEQKTRALIGEVMQLLERLNISQPIAKKYVELLNTRLAQLDADDDFIRSYVQNKANLIEEMAVDIMNSTPGLRDYLEVIQTGNIMDMAGKQLIEDGLSLKKDTQFVGGIKVHVKLDHGTNVGVRRKQVTVHTLDGFIQLLETAAKKNYTIRLEDEAYELLKQTSALKLQVKSGRNQALFTLAERNAVTLRQFNFFVQAGAKPLEEIYNNINEYYPPLKKSAKSQKLNLLANYVLAKNINQTALGRNDLYFTDKGFITAEEYLKEYKKILLFSRAIGQINSNLLDEKRTYVIRDMNRQIKLYGNA